MASIHFQVSSDNVLLGEGLDSATVMIDVRHAFDRIISGIKSHAEHGYPFTEADAVELIVSAEAIRQNIE